MIFSTKKFLIAILFVFALQFAGAQAQTTDWLNYTSGKNVTSLANDGNYLWIGTDGGGLVRMHKTTFAMNFYNKTNSGIPGNMIVSLAVDGSGNKWIGTYQGLYKFNGTTWTAYNKGNAGLPSDSILSISIDNSGNKWIATPNAVVKFDSTTRTVYTIGGSSIHSTWVYTVKVAPNNFIWVGGDVGIDVFDGTNWNWYLPNNSGIPDFAINTIGFLGNGRVIVGSKTKGAAYKNIGDTTWFRLNTSNSLIPSNQINCVAGDTSGAMWFGTGSGLAKYLTNWWIYNTSNSIIPSNNVTALQFDASLSMMWFGTPSNLGRLAGTTMTTYSPSSYPIPENKVRFVNSDLYGNKWFASANYGVYKYDANSWSSYRYSPTGLASDRVTYIGIDGYNNKWFCSDSGLTKFTDSTWTTYKRRNSFIPSDTITAVAFEGSNVWVGTAGYGLAKFNGSTWVKYTTTNSGIPDDNITSIYIDKFGKKWVGTKSRGVAVYDNTDWTVYDNTSGLPSNQINAIAAEGNKKWFATPGGAASFDDAVWVSYSTGNSGIPENNITTLGIDNSGKKWFGSAGSGFFSYDGTIWSAFRTSSSPLTVDRINSLFVDPVGNKWVGTEDGGLYVFKSGGILPSVSTLPISGPFCVDAQVNVVYSAFASASFVNFGAANVFTAQLSDPNGSFATPINIGILTSQTSGTIATRLPKTLTYGTGYRIRVISSSPSLTFGDDGKDFTVFELPKPAITGNTSVCSAGFETYKTSAVPGISFSWVVNGGTISGSSIDSILKVTWGAKGNGSIKLYQTTAAGCKDSVTANILISSRPPRVIYGDTVVCANRYEVYTTVQDTSLKNEWIAVGGKVIDIPQFNNVRILWDFPGNGQVKLIQTTRSGCKDSSTISIRKILSPSTSFTGADTVKHSSTSVYNTNPPASGINNKWYVTGGNVVGSSTGNSLTVKWGLGKYGSVKLVQATAAGCSDSSENSVFIYEPVYVTGKTAVCENLPQDYYSTSNLEADCKWEVTGGTVSGADNQKIFNVNWGKAGKGTVKLIQIYKSSGYRDTLLINVTINPKPGKPKVTEKSGTLTSDIATGNQWFLNGFKIKDATEQTYYTNEKSGVYTVQISDSIGCIGDMSDAFNFVSSVPEISDENSGIRLYPNPSDGKINISIETSRKENINVQVINLLGTSVYSGQFDGESGIKSFELHNFAEGLYIVKLQIGNEQYQKRIILKK